MMPLRILHTESSLTLGGQEFRILIEAEGMRERGHTIILAIPQESLLRRCAEERGVPIELVSMKKWRYGSLVFDFLHLIKKHRIQIVNTHGSVDSWTASAAGRMSRRRPVVVRTRHKSTQISRSLRHRVLYQYLPHAIITTGEAIRNELIAEQQVNPDRIVSIPTGVDLQMYRPTMPDPTLRAGFGLSGNQVLVGTIAFLRSYKGLDYLLEAARMLTRSCPDVRFLIVGDGPEAERLKRTINQLNLEECVFLAGYRKDIHRVLASMDIFVLPSVEGEGLSQSLTQAMAMECPVVATDVGSVREVVQHRVTGLLTKPKDAAALAEQIMVLLEDPPFGAKMAQMARALVEESYSLQRMITQTEEFYVRLLSE